jgi:hypothetical protein
MRVQFRYRHRNVWQLSGIRTSEDFTEHADGENYEMNRDQIIAKTLDDMRAYETDFEHSAPGSADRDAEYNREIFIPEMLKRLPDGEIITCDELQLEPDAVQPATGYTHTMK